MRALIAILLLSVSDSFQQIRLAPRQATSAWIGANCKPEAHSRTSLNQSKNPIDSDLKASTTASGGEFSGSADDTSSRPSFPVILWRFTRPHTLIGSALAIPALHCLAAPTLGAAISPLNIQAMIYAMIPALLMNLYITGLNQITDVEIDKINKPNLVIPAGLLSKKDATVTVVLSLILSLSLGLCIPRFTTQGLNVALWGSAILGTLYSLPPFRLKRFPLLAAFCIVAVRGTIINASFFAHAKAASFAGSGSGSVLACLATDPRCYGSSAFFAIFGLVIALMKDVPDVAGDAKSSIRTFSVRFGEDRVLKAMRRLLSGLFWAFGAGFWRASLLQGTPMHLRVCRAIAGSMGLLGGWSVRQEAQGVDPKDPGQVYNYYMHLWKLFYLSYLVLPFAR